MGREDASTTGMYLWRRETQPKSSLSGAEGKIGRVKDGQRCGRNSRYRNSINQSTIYNNSDLKDSFCKVQDFLDNRS